MSTMFEAEVTVGDLEGDTPEDAAIALLTWIKAGGDPIIVGVTDVDTGKSVSVEVFPDMHARRWAP